MAAGPTVRARRRVDAPEYRAFSARVARAVRLSPHFVRITFTGPDLTAFGYAGHDQRVKILLPQPGRTLADLPRGEDWYLRWRRLPDDVRPTMRTYTVRSCRPREGEMDVDFVLHGHGEGAGPVSTWAGRARPGDEVALLGPDRPGAGRLWGAEWSPPESTSRVLLAGDETAVPAIAAVLQGMPAHLRGVVLAEVPEPADALGFAAPDGIDVRWLVRRTPHADVPRGALLEEGVRDALGGLLGVRDGEPGWTEDDQGDTGLVWDVPVDDPGPAADLYVWMAGEAEVMKRLRRLARHDHALSRAAVACMGYWRRGQAEPL